MEQQNHMLDLNSALFYTEKWRESYLFSTPFFRMFGEFLQISSVADSKNPLK